MGKKSLIKSTAKKKTAPKKEGGATTKKAATKTTKKATAKTTKKAAAKTTKKAAAKTTKKTTDKAAKPAVKSTAKAKKLSLKELIFLKFEPVGPVPDKRPAPQAAAAAAPTAPPLITAQEAAEVDRLQTLLTKKFSMNEVRAAAKAPAEKPAAASEAPPVEPEQKAPAGPALAPEAWIAKDEPEAEPVAEAPPAETTEARTEPATQPTEEEVDEPAPQPAAAEPTPAEPRPVMKPAKVVRKTIETPAPAPEPRPESAKVAATTCHAEPESQSDPVVRSAKIAAAAAALIILILLAVSANNSGKFYIKPIDNAVEIWKGDFSPKDKSFYMVLHGVQAPEPQQSVYSRKDVFPIIFNYYIDKSDTLLDVDGLPDFEGIKNYLHEAQDFAITDEMKSAVKERLNTIDRMVLLYKADVAISRNTEDSLESAMEILEDAGRLTSSTAQDEEIAQKLDLAREKMKALKTPAPAPEADHSGEAAQDVPQHPSE
jgi:colicin import membrane protein